MMWQPLIPLAMAIVLCVAVVQARTPHITDEALKRQATRVLQGSMFLLKAYLQPLGMEWSRAEGQLRLGGNPVAGRHDIVDRATVSGGLAILFSEAERVTTNVRRSGGTRAVGTRPDDPAVGAAALQDERPYQ